MASAVNHRKRSHKSDKIHRQAVYSMKQYISPHYLISLMGGYR